MLLRLIRKLNAQGLGIIMVTHDMDILAEHADKVIVINQGELAFDGTPLDLFSQKELTLKLGLELPEAVCISQELGLDICLTPMEIYAHLHKRG